jgi:tRNA nucleotidyltransferase/poly(A) polymerase
MKQLKVKNNFFVPKSQYERFALEVYNLLVENFYDTFFVGGMVRNLFWQNKVADIDIATIAEPNQVAKLLQKHGHQLNLSGRKFGVINVMTGKKGVQITTMRTERYSNSRYPEVVFTKSLQLDAVRRDFTVNSLYFQHKKGIILDPCEGLADIASKTLRTVGEPEIRFHEDPLRIVRAWRFQHEFGLHFDNETKIALHQLQHLTSKLTKTKVQSEINKSVSQNVKTFLQNKFV